MQGQGASLRRRLALLIDAENIADASLVRRLLDLLGRHGEVRIRRAYGDWSGERLRRWREALTQHAIQAVQVFPVAAGKNAADIALVVDAMDLLHAGIDGICLLASDSDYTRLVLRLREADRFVIVAGRDTTPVALRAAADLFVALEPLGEPAVDRLLPVKPMAAVQLSFITDGDPAHSALTQDALLKELAAGLGLQSGDVPSDASGSETGTVAVPDTVPITADDIRKALRTVLSGGDWHSMSSLGNALRQQDARIRPKAMGFRTLGRLLAAQGDLVEMRPHASDPGGEARLRPVAARTDAAALLRAVLNTMHWLPLNQLGQALRKVEPGFDVKHYGHAQLQKLLRAHPLLVECRPASGTVQHVRLRP